VWENAFDVEVFTEYAGAKLFNVLHVPQQWVELFDFQFLTHLVPNIYRPLEALLVKPVREIDPISTWQVLGVI
jgi:hypothetical protein